MLGVGDKFPEFNLKATSAAKLSDIDIDNVFIDVSDKEYKGKWLVAFFYPKDFTFVCPTEIAAFGDLLEDFEDRDTKILGGSTDSEFVHWAWRRHQEELTNLPFPLLADVKRELCSALGILDKAEGVAQRATYIIDPDGIIRHVSVYDLNVGRNPKETLRVLDALQTDDLCPCNWSKGDETIDLKEVSK
ncbi:MAG: peroxiredoxin [SAR324 cluster bacterium]|nr:peroxiredoxin [SAR324 cluster bacterium]